MKYTENPIWCIVYLRICRVYMKMNDYRYKLPFESEVIFFQSKNFENIE